MSKPRKRDWLGAIGEARREGRREGLTVAVRQHKVKML